MKNHWFNNIKNMWDRDIKSKWGKNIKDNSFLFLILNVNNTDNNKNIKNLSIKISIQKSRTKNSYIMLCSS